MTPQHKLLKAVHQRGCGQAVLEPVLEVAVLVQLGVQPTGLKGGGVGAQFIMLPTSHHGLISSLGRQHAGLDRSVTAFDAAHVQIAGIAADQCATWEHGLGQGVEAAGIDGPGPVGHTLGCHLALVVFEVITHVGVGFPALQLFKRA